MLQQKRRKKRRRHASPQAFLLLFLMLVITAAGIYGIIRILKGPDTDKPRRPVNSIEETVAVMVTEPPTEPPTEAPTLAVSYPERDSSITQIGTGIESGYAILVDVDNNRVIAEKDSQTVIYPASMTKLLTVVVAIESIEEDPTKSFDDTFTMTDEILAPLYQSLASMAGFQSGEECSITDLLYGAALPSGADATTALALYTAGSEEEFVKWMNDKVEELGLKNTHFTNASGLHDPNHYSTVEDIALIMEYCLQNEMCKQIISTYTRTTQPSPQSPEGVLMVSTMFARMYGTEVPGITILGGKTGFTDEAGNCLASYAQTPDGHTYIAVTAMGATKWKPVFDAFRIYDLITVSGAHPMLEPGEVTTDYTDDSAVTGY